jgi:hypothetical protein
LDVGSPMLYQLRLLTRLMVKGLCPDEKGLPFLGTIFNPRLLVLGEPMFWNNWRFKQQIKRIIRSFGPENATGSG